MNVTQRQRMSGEHKHNATNGGEHNMNMTQRRRMSEEHKHITTNARGAQPKRESSTATLPQQRQHVRRAQLSVGAALHRSVSSTQRCTAKQPPSNSNAMANAKRTRCDLISGTCAMAKSKAFWCRLTSSLSFLG